MQTTTDDSSFARASVGAVALLAVGAAAAAAYAAAFARGTQRARLVVVCICNGATDPEDVDHAVEQVFCRANDPQRTQLRIVAPVDAVVELNAFRARRLAQFLHAPEAARRALHANTSIVPAVDLRLRHARADLQVSYLPALAAQLRNVADAMTPQERSETVLLALGAPGTFALRKGYDERVVSACRVIETTDQETDQDQNQRAVVSLAPDLAARVHRAPDSARAAKLLLRDIQLHADEVDLLAAETEPCRPRDVVFAATRVDPDDEDDDDDDDEKDEHDGGASTRDDRESDENEQADDDTARVLHPEALAAAAHDWLLLLDVVQTRYGDSLLRMRTQTHLPDATEWAHRAAARAGYGAISAIASPLLAGFSGKNKRQRLLRLRNSAPLARARLSECVALTLAAEALAPQLQIAQLNGPLLRDPQTHAAIFPVCSCSCAAAGKHAAPVGTRVGPQQRLSRAVIYARAQNDAT